MELTANESKLITADSKVVDGCNSTVATVVDGHTESESNGSGETLNEMETPKEVSEIQQSMSDLPITTKAPKKKKKHGKKKEKTVVITDDDFGPLTDFTKQEGFVYDPEKAEFDINEVRFEKRPWVIPDVRSVLYLRRLERKHNKLVHGLASVRKLTPKQILKEESMNY